MSGMLTVQQAEIMNLLSDFNCLRYSHIEKYMAFKHNSTKVHISAMTNQLRYLNLIRIEDDFVKLPGRKADYGLITAFDVVMELSKGCIQEPKPGKYPFTLMFSVKPEKDTEVCNNFGAVTVERFLENSIIEHLRHIDRDLTVIFILQDKEQKKLLKTNNRSYFAVQNEDGKYKFFKAAGKAVK